MVLWSLRARSWWLVVFFFGRVSFEILSFACIFALLTADISSETNSFRSNWFMRFISANGFIRSRFPARNCWLACFSWTGYPRNGELRLETCSAETCDELRQTGFESTGCCVCFSIMVLWSLRARSCWLVVFFWPGWFWNTELRLDICSIDSWYQFWDKLVSK